MKKENWLVIIAGVLVGVAALVLTKLGNPANMGFCIACFERDIAGAVGLHSAASVHWCSSVAPCGWFCVWAVAT